MTTAPVELNGWPRRRWALVVAVVLAAQIGIILGLSDRIRPAPRPVRNAPVTYLSANAGATGRELVNPTLFALAHPRGFSGPAWLEVPPLSPKHSEWTEPPVWLPLEADRLGEVLTRHVRGATPVPFEAADNPEPELAKASAHASVQTVAKETVVRFEGSLAARAHSTALTLPVWPHGDVLSNTVVQLAVQPDGRALAATVLGRSGSAEADQAAMRLALGTRFEPLSAPDNESAGPGRLQWGRMIVHWRTTPPAAAASPEAPSP